MKLPEIGGAGYIGSITSEVQLQAGHEVAVLDNLVQRHRAAVPSAIIWRANRAQTAGARRWRERARDCHCHPPGRVLRIANARRAAFDQLQGPEARDGRVLRNGEDPKSEFISPIKLCRSHNIVEWRHGQETYKK